MAGQSKIQIGQRIGIFKVLDKVKEDGIVKYTVKCSACGTIKNERAQRIKRSKLCSQSCILREFH